MGRSRPLRVNIKLTRHKRYSQIQEKRSHSQTQEEENFTPPEWVVNINEFLYEGKPLESETSSSIFAVPTDLSEVQKDALFPKIVPIGPFHFEKDATYDYKLDYLLRLLKPKDNRMNGERAVEVGLPSRTSLAEIVKAMMKLELQVKKCYSKPFDDISSEDFVNTMVVDGCFVIELLRLHHKLITGQDLNVENGALNKRWLLPTIQRDLIKLENQLPFFILEELFWMTKSGIEEPSGIDLKSLFLSFFHPMLRVNKSIHTLEFNVNRNCAHPLDLFRSSFVFKMEQKFQQMKQESNAFRKRFIENPQLIYSAQELQEAGVKFIKKEKSILLDISFDKGVLQIPPLCIDENMTTVLMNFVAYEQCDDSQDPIFTNYFLFLDSLINAEKDVEILRKNGIIRYPLGTEKQVVDLFINFCKKMLYDFDQTYLFVDMNAVNNYCKAYYDSRWHTWWSDLKKERFSSPWTFLSLVAAIILLILTMLQTFYTVFPYYHSN